MWIIGGQLLSPRSALPPTNSSLIYTSRRVASNTNGWYRKPYDEHVPLAKAGQNWMVPGKYSSNCLKLMEASLLVLPPSPLTSPVKCVCMCFYSVHGNACVLVRGLLSTQSRANLRRLCPWFDSLCDWVP